jgi:hypothetical protein
MGMHNLLSTVKWLLIILVILAWLALCLVNGGAEVRPFKVIPNVFEFETLPVSILLIFPLAFAFVTFFIVGFLDQVDHFLQARELNKRIRDLEDEVSKLRNLPIREGLLSQRVIEEENHP